MSTPAASPWAGLGRRSGSACESPAEDDFERPIVQRTVAATEALALAPLTTPAGGVPWPWPSAGRAEPPDDERAAQETSVPRTHPPTPHPVRRNSQTRLCEQLLAAPSLTRDQLAQRLPDLDSKQLSQALFNANGAGRCERLDGDVQAWRLTALGRRWIKTKLGDAAPPGAKAAPAKRAKPGAKVRRRRAETAEIAAADTRLAVREFEPVVERSFRCAVFSDGAFHLAKNGQAIDLTAAEHAEMLRYIERMAAEA